MVSRRRFLLDSGSGLWLASAQSRDLEVRIVDAVTGRPTPARVRLLDQHGGEVVPAGHVAELAPDAVQGDVRFSSRRFCYIDGRFTIPANLLPLRYLVLKGYEYRIEEGTLTADSWKDGIATIRLERWSSMNRDGWRGGDIHIHHISPKTCRLEMDAEDLDVANILTSDFTTDQNEFEGRLNANSSSGRLIYVSQEFRHNHLGHMCVLNLKKLIEPVRTMQAEHYPLHMRACDEAHAQGGYVAWAHFPSWPGLESPLDVAMGKLDGLEILSVLDPREFPVFVRQTVPELESNDGLRLWYRYLNCGFRLTATAGTDKMTTFVTVGSNRVYAKTDGEFSYRNWIRALKRGRTFITNSPMLRFTVNGAEAGEVLELSPRQDKVLVQAEAESQLPYDRLEIVVNGVVAADATPSGARHRASVELNLPVTRSCWIAARVLEDLAPYQARQVNFPGVHEVRGTRHGEYYGTRRPETVFAHSSPFYVIRDSRPIRSAADAEYYVRYLDTAMAWLEKEGKFARPSDKKATLEAFDQGRRVYRARAAEDR